MVSRRIWLLAGLSILFLAFSFLPLYTFTTATAESRCNWAGFLADVTVPDGSTHPANETFTKTWRLKNIGTCTWTSSYTLVYARGDRMNSPLSIALPGRVAPGESVDLSLTLKAPSTPGHYRGYWQFRAPNGSLFGIGSSATDPIWTDINVLSASTLAYNFAEKVCEATWRSGAGILPCPSTLGDSRGFAVRLETPRLENGVWDNPPGLLLFPENKYNGYIQGLYPEITVQSGDRFQAIVGCEYGSSCYVTYRLDYQIGNGALKTFWKWNEMNEGRIYRVDKDLSSLAGKQVKFVLTLLAAGNASGDRAILAQPQLVRLSSEPTPTPPGPTSTSPGATPTATFTPLPPPAGVAYEFANHLCDATWRSGAGVLPCPVVSTDSRGFAVRINTPRLEDYSLDELPGILVVPNESTEGYIQGTYPEYTVRAGDHFQSIIGCEYGKSCYVTFRLEYQVNNGPNQILGQWVEQKEGLTYSVDRDLSFLAGQNVKFTLTLLATGSAANDIAIWARPRILQSDTPPPSFTPGSETPSPTFTATPPVLTAVPPTPFPGTLYDFASNACAAAWSSAAGALPCPGIEGDARGFVLPTANQQLESGVIDPAPALILFPQNKYNGLIKGIYPAIQVQAGDRFQAIVGCAYGSPCNVTFRLDYQVGNGPVSTYWTWKEKNEGLFYIVNKDLSTLAGKNVKFILTILASGSASGDRALWSQPRLVRPGYMTPTPTPTSTPDPSIRVTGATIEVARPFNILCGASNYVDVYGSISTNGPVTVSYHWELGGDKTQVSNEETLVFSGAATRPLHGGTYNLDCGSYTARLVISGPNGYSALIYFSLYPNDTTPPPSATPTPTATLTPSPTPTTTAVETISPTVRPGMGPYAVILIASGDVLNVRSAPGVENPIISSFGPAARDIWRTGAETGSWVEVYLPGDATGWVNSTYLTEQVDGSFFCADARVPVLIDQSLKTAMQTSSGNLFAGLVHARHGLAVRRWAYGPAVTFTPYGASLAFISPTIYNWGGGPSGQPTYGTFAEVIQPRLNEVLSASHDLYCNTAAHTGPVINHWENGYANINFYELYKPSSPGNLDFRTILVGIEYVDGLPYLFAMVNFEWEP